jgi:uncharacterized protein YuzE
MNIASISIDRQDRVLLVDLDEHGKVVNSKVPRR